MSRVNAEQALPLRTLNYLYTSIATSGQTKAQSMHPVQASGLTIHAGWYPVGLKFLDKAITLCGHATIHNSQPLHLFSSTSILGIKISPKDSFYPKTNLIIEKLSGNEFLSKLRNLFFKSKGICNFFHKVMTSPPGPPLHFVGVSELCFDVVAAIFRLRKLLEFNKRFSQTKVCGYKKPKYDTVCLWRGG